MPCGQPPLDFGHLRAYVGHERNANQTVGRKLKPVKRHLYIAIPMALAAALLVGSPAHAQRGFGGRRAPSGGAGLTRPHGMGSTFASPRGVRSGFGFRRAGWGYGLGWGYFPLPDDYYDRGEDYARPDMEPPEPQPPVAYEPSQPPKVIQPILIERQGNAWVQVSSYKQATVSGLDNATQPVNVAPTRAEGAGNKPETPNAIPPAVLVFRDGHQEEVKGYTIIGGTLYAKSEYWSTGVWTRKVELADLNVPATLKVNQEHGTPFKLPSGPLEVIISP